METIKIGDQVWSIDNSIIKKFSNGEDIHHCTSKEDWEECGLIEKPAWCYYDFDEKNEKYGLLYNGYVFIHKEGEFGEDGFRTPDFDDWYELEESIGGRENVDSLKSDNGWFKVSEDNVSNNPITYNDNFGFKCLPSGWVNRKGEFSQLGRGIGTSSSLAKFWTETDDDTGKLWCRIFGRRFISHAGEPENGYSVRLIKGDKID